MAFANPNITAVAVEATEFPDLARRYHVSGVPKTVVNETTEILAGFEKRVRVVRNLENNGFAGGQNQAIGLCRGEWVLVLGAGGGIGLACIDVAVALGAHVIAAQGRRSFAGTTATFTVTSAR